MTDASAADDARFAALWGGIALWVGLNNGNCRFLVPRPCCCPALSRFGKSSSKGAPHRQNISTEHVAGAAHSREKGNAGLVFRFQLLVLIDSPLSSYHGSRQDLRSGTSGRYLPDPTPQLRKEGKAKLRSEPNRRIALSFVGFRRFVEPP
jgi:hypothetical protein